MALTFKVSHDPCIGKHSNHCRGDGSGRIEDGRRRNERVSSCDSVWGRIAPPPDKEFVGGGLYWAFKHNDGDSDRGFKAGTLDVTMLACWHYDKSAAGRGLCSLAGATTMAAVQTAVLICRCNNESAARRMTVLASWLNDKS